MRLRFARLTMHLKRKHGVLAAKLAEEVLIGGRLELSVAVERLYNRAMHENKDQEEILAAFEDALLGRRGDVNGCAPPPPAKRAKEIFARFLIDRGL